MNEVFFVLWHLGTGKEMHGQCDDEKNRGVILIGPELCNKKHTGIILVSGQYSMMCHHTNLVLLLRVSPSRNINALLFTGREGGGSE